MVAIQAISTALAFTAVTLPVALAGARTVDFSDNYVQPGEIKPLYSSHGYQFEHFDLIGGVLDAAGNIVEDLLTTLGLRGGKKYKYGHGVGIVGGYDGYKPGRIYHSSKKPFNILGLKALCCAGDISNRCEVVDCKIKLSGYDKPQGGKKIYDHEFYIPSSYNKGHGNAPIDIDATVDGVVNLGRHNTALHGLEVHIEILDLIDVDINTKQKHRGRYSYKSRSQNPRTSGLLGLGLLVDADIQLAL
ncbi:hypothetical protein TWF730_004041 [Orbilia blumenaviensis]|uniref:Uncharacterized protein n=1 Tax=Orbilia blumenaviensis TaxID=1796055 RepID=A0AAV9U133_9PEZI